MSLRPVMKSKMMGRMLFLFVGFVDDVIRVDFFIFVISADGDVVVIADGGVVDGDDATIVDSDLVVVVDGYLVVVDGYVVLLLMAMQLLMAM